MINACFKRLKASLATGVRKVVSPIAQISKKRVKISDLSFFDFLDLDEFLTVSLALPSTPTTLLLSILYAFGAKSDDPVVFNMEVSNTAILLKSRIKR